MISSKKLIELNQKYSKILGDEVEVICNLQHGFLNIQLNIVSKNAMDYGLNLFSFNKLNHPNCGMDIIQQVNFTQSIYANNRCKEILKDKNQEIDLIFKDILLNLGFETNKQMFFSFQQPDCVKMLTVHGFDEVYKYTNHNHPHLKRSLLMIDLFGYNIDTELAKLQTKEKKTKATKPKVEAKVKTTRRGRKPKAEAELVEVS